MELNMQQEVQKAIDKIVNYLDLQDISHLKTNYMRLVLENLYSTGQVDGMRTIKKIYDTPESLKILRE